MDFLVSVALIVLVLLTLTLVLLGAAGWLEDWVGGIRRDLDDDDDPEDDE